MRNVSKIRRAILVILLLCALALPAAAREDAPEVITCFINHTWFPVDSFTGIIPEEITRQTGLALNVTIAQNYQQLNQLIALGRLPDIVYSSTMLDKLSDLALCYSYDELMALYGIEWDIPAQLRANALVYSPDGNVYSLINNFACTEDWQDTSAVPIMSSLMVRQDILDEMGIVSIRTTDELADILLRVRDEYPGTVPLTFDSVHRFNIFRCYFGMGLLPFLEQPDGSWLYYSRDERYLEMLRYLNRLYREGCMAADNFAALSSDASLLYDTGRAFAFTGCTQNSNEGRRLKLLALNPGWRSVELYPLDGACYDAAGLGWSGCFITRNAKDPKACLELIKWMYSYEGQRVCEWGREGVDYAIDGSGLPVFSDAVMESMESGTYNEIYNPWFYFGTSAIVEAEGRMALLNDWSVYRDTYAEIRKRYRILPWIAAAIPKAPSEEANIYSRISLVMDDYENKIILSGDDASFDANWRELQAFFDMMDVGTLESYMAERIPVEHERYQASAKGDSSQ